MFAVCDVTEGPEDIFYFRQSIASAAKMDT